MNRVDLCKLRKIAYNFDYYNSYKIKRGFMKGNRNE